MKRYTDEEIEAFRNPLRCFDCGALYGQPDWIEATVPNDVWETINPTYHENAGAGILCIVCMAKRCVEAGYYGVPMRLYGIFTHEQPAEPPAQPPDGERGT